MNFDCIIIGGGIAGLQAAIQLGRYQHNILVIDAGVGRSMLCRRYHNILGYPEGVSGENLRDLGRRQAEDLGVNFVLEKAVKLEKKEAEFHITAHSGKLYKGRRILISTGVMDRLPPISSLYPCLGKSIYVCPDCDGYEIKNRKTIVLGSGNVGASMALTLSYWTNDLIYVNHEQVEVGLDLLAQLKEKQIEYVNRPIRDILEKDGYMEGILFQNGDRIVAQHAFVAFGSNEVKSDLAEQLGIERLENKHIVVNPRTKMTSVKNVWAAGDVVAHSEQVTIAMGDGSQAAIWIHKSLL